MNDTVWMGIFIVCAFLGLAGFLVSCICVAMIAGFVRSTHTVQYVPHENTLPEIDPDLAAENEKALLDQVGRKKKDKPTVVEDLDAPLEEIAQSDIKF